MEGHLLRTRGLAPGLALGLALTGAGCGAAEPTTSAPESTASTGDLASDLYALREEEKLARDVYRTSSARWGLAAFLRIAESEQRHFDHVGALLGPRDLVDPVRDDAVGAFVAPRFSSLFLELSERSARSELDALLVGALIEELDIADLDGMLARTSDGEVRQVYELLRCGSRNHLRAFDALLHERGESYAPVHLSPERYAEIAAGAHERCGREYGGPGMGPGMGNGMGPGMGNGMGNGRGPGARGGL
jgi:hypothetical protein